MTKRSGYWYAEVPMIPGCGLSCYPLEHVLESIQDTAQVMLEMRVEYGDPLPEGLEDPYSEIVPGSEPLFSEKAITVII